MSLAAGLPQNQFEETQAILLGLDDDALLKPFRLMAGEPAPGRDIGGWYRYDPDYVLGKDDAGFCPGHSFGQWVSALSRGYAITGSQETRDRVLRLNRLLGESISGDYFEKTRFPAYSYDKLVCGLIDAQKFAGDPDAFATLGKVTEIATPHLPGKAIERDTQWRPGKDYSFGWDESYTLPENLFLAWERGAGDGYREMAAKYLMDSTFFDPLSRGENVFAGRHAYSTVNSLSSGMQAYLALGSDKHLLAVKNAYGMLLAQSFATGGWGPDEQLRAPDSDALFESLAKTHQSFETPCGAYAHFKLTRYLLRVTRDSRYGDSMERVLYNTVLGARTLEPDGRAFYYSDYNFKGQPRLFEPHLAVLLRDVAAGCGGLSHQHLLSGWPRCLCEPLPPVDLAMDGGWQECLARANDGVSVERDGADEAELRSRRGALRQICAIAADSGLGGGRLGFDQWEATPGCDRCWKLFPCGTEMASRRRDRAHVADAAAPGSNPPAAS